ncbi:hypothetical protein IU450_12395 [Nocardia abscessus]|nr:hypothetical protein [Nocardia abscessus]
MVELHTAQPDMHRLLFDQAPRTPKASRACGNSKRPSQRRRMLPGRHRSLDPSAHSAGRPWPIGRRIIVSQPAQADSASKPGPAAIGASVVPRSP